MTKIAVNGATPFTGVRKAEPQEHEAIFELLKLMHAEVGREPMNEEKVRARIRQCADHGFLLVAVCDQEVVGICGLVFTQFWYGDLWHLADTFFFVHPERRQSSYAARLMRFGDALAAELGLELIWTCVVNEQTRRKLNFFARHHDEYARVYIGGKV